MAFTMDFGLLTWYLRGRISMRSERPRRVTSVANTSVESVSAPVGQMSSQQWHCTQRPV
jgi:hypothetical protein